MRPGMPSAKGTSLGRPSPAMDQKVLLGRQVTARSHSSEATAEAVAVYISLNKTQKMLKLRKRGFHSTSESPPCAVTSRRCYVEQGVQKWKKKKRKKKRKKRVLQPQQTTFDSISLLNTLRSFWLFISFSLRRMLPWVSFKRKWCLQSPK